MKKKIVIALLATAACSITHSFAQEEPVTSPKPKKFSIGVQAMIINNPVGNYHLQQYGGGVYMRHFLGKHLALSAQANLTYGARMGVDLADVQRKSFDVPVLLEYHLLPGSKVRPYFAAGAGITGQHNSVMFRDGQPNTYTYTQSPFLQAAYGMTFNIGQKMSLHTSMFYRYNLDSRQSSMGLSIGLMRKR
ncbi:MAG TPA: outer membrane beta-barrel protein [Flavipsychrobacter sp.]|nr:outer membrane beta-barrel protein [Flavipsychrobacter sp.]